MIVGVTGPIGSGKTTASELFKKHFNFNQTSLSDALRDKLKEDGIKITRDNLRNEGDKLRTEFGKGILSKRALKKVKTDDEDWVIESVRSPEEASEIQKRGIMIGITAPDRTRYERTVKRGRDTEEVNLSFEDFKKKDSRDREIGIDDALKLCDYILDNDGTREDLKMRLEELLTQIKK